ncbi:hypothetical protein AVEN_104369-1 [Araneus ventricosus]|uniref:Uncharacterized protein n=1 Tax=Araneus ventricosus TaxID=182803 RepID=A0A4Y2PHR8_ARAVE|nr:hypothetical protein AVEN_104369-1 [Araneus ventricosus]
MKQKMKEFQIQESEEMSKKAKSGCKQMLKGLQNEDGDNLQKIENADFRGQVYFDSFSHGYSHKGDSGPSEKYIKLLSSSYRCDTCIRVPD